MKIEEVIKLVKQLDAMTDEDFRVLENIVFVRGLAREIKLKHPLRLNGFWVLKDCNPNHEP